MISRGGGRLETFLDHVCLRSDGGVRLRHYRQRDHARADHVWAESLRRICWDRFITRLGTLFPATLNFYVR